MVPCRSLWSRQIRAAVFWLPAILLLILALAGCDGRPAPNPVVQRPAEEISDGLRLQPEESQWDGYGQAVDVRGDLMVVGASDWNTDGAGSAYVYRFSESEQTWREEARLLPSGQDGSRAGHLFGAAVAIGNGLIAVGAPGADDPIYGANTGAVYLFEQVEGRWLEGAKLRPNRSDRDSLQETIEWLQKGSLRRPVYGALVALDGDTLVVGGESWSRTAYVYRRDEDGWQEQARLTIPEIADKYPYMASLALAGDTLALSALYLPLPPDPLVAPFVRGVVTVYLFQRSGDVWREQFRYSPEPDGVELLFARQVHLGADVALGGRPDRPDLLAVGVSGFPDLSHFRDRLRQYPGVSFPKSVRPAGSVTLFERVGNGRWQEQTMLALPGSDNPPAAGPMFAEDDRISPLGMPLDEQGNLVSSDPEALYVFPGHFYSEGPEVSFFGATVAFDEARLAATVGYTNMTLVFERSSAGWIDRFRVRPRPENGIFWEDYAQAAALSGDTLLLGTPGEFGDSAYVFELPD